MMKNKMAQGLVIGLITGVLLSIGFTASAEQVNKFLGKTIKGVYPVYIDGERFSEDAVVADGQSLLPVKKFGEALGREVVWKDGVIELNTIKKEVEPSVGDSTIDTTLSLDEINEKIKTVTANILITQNQLKGYEISPPSDISLIDKYKQKLAQYEADLADLQARKDELEEKK